MKGQFTWHNLQSLKASGVYSLRGVPGLFTVSTNYMAGSNPDGAGRKHIDVSGQSTVLEHRPVATNATGLRRLGALF